MCTLLVLGDKFKPNENEFSSSPEREVPNTKGTQNDETDWSTSSKNEKEFYNELETLKKAFDSENAKAYTEGGSMPITGQKTSK